MMATPHSSSNVHPLFLASIDDFHLSQLLTWWLHNWFYINVQIISDLDRRRPFTLAALSFWHIPITLWVLTNFLAQMETQRCAKLTLYFPCRHHFTQRRPVCFQWGIRFRNQGLGTKVYSLLPGSDLGLKGQIDLGVCVCMCVYSVSSYQYLQFQPSATGSHYSVHNSLFVSPDTNNDKPDFHSPVTNKK